MSIVDDIDKDIEAGRADARAQFEEFARDKGWNLCRKANSDDYGFAVASAGWAAWQAALVARQLAEPSPSNVEILANALGYFHNAALGHAADASHHGPASGYDVVAAIAIGLGAVAAGLRENAQAAQPVELGRARASIQSLLNWIDDWAETPEESGIDAIEAEAEAVLALIDSRQTG